MQGDENSFVSWNVSVTTGYKNIPFQQLTQEMHVHVIFWFYVGNVPWHCDPASFDNTNGIVVVSIMHSKTYWLTL